MNRTWVPFLLLFIGSLQGFAQSAAEPPATSAEPAMHEGHHHDMNMNMPDEPPDPVKQAKLLADKVESEFNHHLAGLFVVLGAAFMLAHEGIARKWPFGIWIWPLSFLLSGLFVLIWSDTELWPFGHRQWLEALQNNPEVLQHKIFAVLLLGLGTIEGLRANGKLRTMWSGLVFPLLAIGGSILLLFHHHEAGMHGANHMELMARIQSEHWTYAMVGVGIGLSKGLAEVQSPAQKILSKVWPSLMLLLGILLTFYRE